MSLKKTKLDYKNEIKNIAKKRGGYLLSRKYINNSTKLKFKCNNNHTFYTSPNCIKRGHWCPRCKPNSRCEEICRIYFESIFSTSFPKTRPTWLINEKGNKLELDGYSEILKLAFEHNGTQHYQIVAQFCPDNKKLIEIQYHDKIKQKLCKENEVKLISIPQLGSKTKLNKLMDFIKTELIKLNFDISNLNLDEPDISPAYTNNNKYNNIKNLIESKNGKLLDKKYCGTMYRYSVLCNNCGYKWKITINNLKKGTWCKNCAGKLKKTIQDAQLLAKENGGICLSTKYKNNSSKLEWQCQCGFIWYSTYNNIQRGNWCPKDWQKKKSESLKKWWKSEKENINKEKLIKIKNFAIEHNLKCISTEYIDCDKPLDFVCKNNHIWSLGFRSLKKAIKENRYCTHCKL